MRRVYRHEFRTLFVAAFSCAAAALVVLSGARADARTRIFELQPMVGYSFVNMTGVSEDKFVATYQDATPEEMAEAVNDPNAALAAAQVPVEGQGLSVGAAAQLKLWVFVLGGRYAYTNASALHLHTLGADVGLRLGNPVSVYGRLGVGYAYQSGLPDGLSTRGVLAAGSAGLEVRIDPAFSVGAGLDADLLFMSQDGQLQAASNLTSGSTSAAELRALDGSAIGYQLRPQLHFIWHI
jgi:hypothetical protein